MGFFASFFKSTPKNSVTPFETFLRAFSDDPQLADKKIMETKQSNRLMTGLCLACLHGGYTITTQIRASLADLQDLPGTSRSAPFPFDAVSQEVIAFVFYTVMAEHMPQDDEAENEGDDENQIESHQFMALNEARYLADCLATKYMPGRSAEFFRQRLLSYLLTAHKRNSVPEEAANYVLNALRRESAHGYLNEAMAFLVIQSALVSNMLTAVKNGVNRLYAELCS